MDYRLRICPQAFLALSRLLLKLLQYCISWRILPIPPTPAVFDKLLIQVDPTRQDHIPKGAPVLVVAVGLDGHVLPKGKDPGGVLGSRAIGLALLRAVDPSVEEGPFPASMCASVHTTA